MSFPAGSAGGPDGLRPQHLRDMMLSNESGPELLRILTAFVNMVLAGGCPINVAQIFSLVAAYSHLLRSQGGFGQL